MEKSGDLKNQMNESALACQARNGDTDAPVQLLQNNWLWLKGLIYNVLKRPDEIDDVLQGVCILAIEKIHTLREPERFKPWLTTVARNAALAHRQKMSRKPMQLDDLIASQQPDPRMPGALENLTRREQMEQLHDAVGKLPDKYREVFILKHIEDMSYAAIAETLDITLTTVQIRLVRARRMIFNHMTGKPTDKVPRT